MKSVGYRHPDMYVTHLRAQYAYDSTLRMSGSVLAELVQRLKLAVDPAEAFVEATHETSIPNKRKQRVKYSPKRKPTHLPYSSHRESRVESRRKHDFLRLLSKTQRHVNQRKHEDKCQHQGSSSGEHRGTLHFL